MAKVIPITERFQHFVEELQESFWGDLYGRTRAAWKKFFELDSERLRDRYAGWNRYRRGPRKPGGYRNGYYTRDFATPFGTIRPRIARARGKNFLPKGIGRFQRRAAELAMLVREAFLRGISTRQVGRVVATLTGEPVSAQSVSRLTRDLDAAVRQFHQAPLRDEWAYLFLDGVSLRVRRPSGRQRVQMLVAYGVRQDGTRQLLAFLRSQGESQTAWEGLLEDLYRRGLKGEKLLLIVTDGCAGLAAAIQTVYPRVLHQRCWGAQDELDRVCCAKLCSLIKASHKPTENRRSELQEKPCSREKEIPMNIVNDNQRLMKTLDDSWNNQDWHTFNKRHIENVAVYWPGQPEPTRGRHDHKAEAVEFFKTFPENYIDNDPYKVLFSQGDWTCSIARFTGTMKGPMKGPDGKMIPATNKRFEVEFCTVAHWKDGEIIEEKLFYDLVGLLRQIGVMPGQAAEKAA